MFIENNNTKNGKKEIRRKRRYDTPSARPHYALPLHPDCTTLQRLLPASNEKIVYLGLKAPNLA